MKQTALTWLFTKCRVGLDSKSVAEGEYVAVEQGKNKREDRERRQFSRKLENFLVPGVTLSKF